MHYLSLIDAFGIQPSLLIKSKPRHRSFFGGILSIFSWNSSRKLCLLFR